MDKTDLSKLVRKQFLQEMADRLPQFEPQGGTGKIAVPGWRSYLWSVADNLHLFIGLGVDAAGEKFTVEGAWHRPPDYPTGQTPILVPNLKEEDFHHSPVVMRLAQRDSAEALVEFAGWEIHAATEQDIHKRVADAVQRIQHDFLPVFARKAARKGIRLG